MTPDDARIWAELKALEIRFARLEKKLRDSAAKPTPVVQSVTQTTAAYRKTLEASPTDVTLHDDYTDHPHINTDQQVRWDAASKEVIQARRSSFLSQTYSSLYARLEAMEKALVINPGINVSDTSGNSIVSATSLNFVGATVSGSPSSGVITVNGGTTLHSHIWNEVPAGVIDSFNTSYTLLHTPLTNDSVILTINGLEQKYGVDYTAAQSSLQLIEAPHTHDVIWVSYIIQSA